MGSATREALATSRAALTALGSKVGLTTGEQLFAAGRVVGDSAQLRTAITDPSASAEAKSALVRSVFSAQLEPAALELINVLSSQRWSRSDDVLAGIEDLGLRATAASAPAGVSIESELFAFGTAVSSDNDLELALASKLSAVPAKVALVEKLLAGKASAQTVAIVRHLVSQPRGRRIGELLRHAATVVADQSGLLVATVTAATPLAAAQLDRLQQGLAAKYGRNIKINQLTDAAVVGGLRVQIGDDVIDGSVASRVQNLRLQLAG